MKISISSSAQSRYWKQINVTWSNIVSLLSNYITTDETMQEFDKLSKDEQSQLKNVGGFVGGHRKTL